jgi:hypothetical protein
MENTMAKLTIGVVGYVRQKFDTDEAQRLLKDAFDQAIREHEATDVEVSVLTDDGIAGLVNNDAVHGGRYWSYSLYDVDIDVNWGENELSLRSFFQEVDVIIRIGNCKQSLAAVAAFKKSKGGKVYERELALDEEEEFNRLVFRPWNLFRI